MQTECRQQASGRLAVLEDGIVVSVFSEPHLES